MKEQGDREREIEERCLERKREFKGKLERYKDRDSATTSSPDMLKEEDTSSLWPLSALE